MLKDETLCGMTLKRSKYMKYTKFRKVIPLRDRRELAQEGAHDCNGNTFLNIFYCLHVTSL